MRKPRVFISHSTSPGNEPFLDQVYTALEQHGGGNSFDVFLDRKEIKTGEEWHQKILKNLCTCDAVVILLSEKALASHWVRQEAAFSAMRRYGDPSLKLVVVTLDNIDAKTIEACPYLGGVARLHDVQFAPKNKTPDEIIAELAGLTTHIYSPVGNLLLRMSETLEYIHSATLERTIRLLDYNCIAKLSWNTHFAYTLALSVANEHPKAWENLLILLQEIRHVPKRHEIANILLEMVKPLWVEPEVAKNLSLAQQQRSPLITTGINPENFTAESYADRAWGNGNHQLVPIGSCRSMKEIEAIMRETVGSKTMPKHLAEKCLLTATDPIVLVFPVPDDDSDTAFLPDENLLQELMKKYPTTAVFIPTGETLPEGRPDLQKLTPLLDTDAEGNHYLAYHRVKKYIEESM